MLGRTASSLFWISRYMERAENMARMLDVGYRVSLMPGIDSTEHEQWESTLNAAGIAERFFTTHETASLPHIRDFMLFDKHNPSSVYNCLSAARTNARSVRTAITTEMWESINETWIEYSTIRPGQGGASDLIKLLDWIKRNTAQFRGALLNTILRKNGYSFSQLGVFTERADNTARILDVKYYVLLPRADLVGSDVDLRQWSTILRAASAHRSYRHVYRDRYRPRNIADFLILREEMPRSLAHCYNWISATCGDLEKFYQSRCDCHDLADNMYQQLKSTNVDEIFQRGLHEFLGDFIAGNSAFAASVAEDYNFY
jgi:uncharacterized alpha-E superfamily protein